MFTFDEYLQDKLKDAQFAAGFEEAKAELSFGLALAQRREELGLTQKKVADMTGIKQPMLARIERGQIPKPHTIQKLASALKVKIIFTGEKIVLRGNIEKSTGMRDESDFVRSIFNLIFKKESKSEIPISNVLDFEEFKKKRAPLTARNLEKEEGNNESIKSSVG